MLKYFFQIFCLFITSKLWEISGPNTNFDIGGFFWQVHWFYLILIFDSFLKNTNKHFFTWVFFSFSRYFYRLWVDYFHKSIFFNYLCPDCASLMSYLTFVLFFSTLTCMISIMFKYLFYDGAYTYFSLTMDIQLYLNNKYNNKSDL